MSHPQMFSPVCQTTGAECVHGQTAANTSSLILKRTSKMSHQVDLMLGKDVSADFVIEGTNAKILIPRTEK